MTRRGASMLAIAGLISLFITGVASWGQGGLDSGTLPQPVRLLLVDATKTFSATMRVGALAKVIRNTGLFDLSVRLVDVASSYVDPLGAMAFNTETQPYQIILIIPRGIDNGTVNQIWLVTRSFVEVSPPLGAAIGTLSNIVDQVFGGIAEAIDVSEDLFPGFFAALYLKRGILE